MLKRPTTVELVDDLSNEICCAADLSDCVRCMHPDPEYKKAAEEGMRFFTCLVETLNTTPELYGALKKSLHAERGRLDPISVRTAKLLLEDFEQSGVLLEDENRKKFVRLSDEIFDAGSTFVAFCEKPVKLSAREQWQVGRPVDELNGPWTQHADHRVRRLTHRKYFAHSPEQESSLKCLVSARHQLAQLTGFPSFAHRAQANSVLANYENVRHFLRQTIRAFSGRVGPELEQIRQLVQDNSRNFDPSTDQLGLVDVDFATLLRRQQLLDQLGVEPSRLASFFSLGSVLNGLEWLVGQLYGIHVKRSLPEEGECWPGNVFRLDMERRGADASSTFLGTIYLDVDARPSKLQGDCHFTVRCSKQLNALHFQTPIVVLSLAIVSPSSSSSASSPLDLLDRAKMGPQQAENLFHEFGHAMHSILGRTRFQHVAGTRCSTDFAEVPSHLMECLFNDTRILQRICRDQAGQPLDADTARVLVRSRKVFNGIHTLNQSIYALFDLELHGERAEDVASGRSSTTELFAQYCRESLPKGLEIEPGFAYHHRISHLVTYGAKYYSYLVARASAALIYQRLFAADPSSARSGQQWAAVQAHGGEHSADVLLAKALAGSGGEGEGKAPGPEQLTAVLLAEETGAKA